MIFPLRPVIIKGCDNFVIVTPGWYFYLVPDRIRAVYPAGTRTQTRSGCGALVERGLWVAIRCHQPERLLSRREPVKYLWRTSPISQSLVSTQGSQVVFHFAREDHSRRLYMLNQPEHPTQTPDKQILAECSLGQWSNNTWGEKVRRTLLCPRYSSNVIMSPTSWYISST